MEQNRGSLTFGYLLQCIIEVLIFESVFLYRSFRYPTVFADNGEMHIRTGPLPSVKISIVCDFKEPSGELIPFFKSRRAQIRLNKCILGNILRLFPIPTTQSNQEPSKWFLINLDKFYETFGVQYAWLFQQSLADEFPCVEEWDKKGQTYSKKDTSNYAE